MKAYIVSQRVAEPLNGCIEQLAHVELEYSRTVPVLAVADTYNLRTLTDATGDVTRICDAQRVLFRLDDFRGDHALTSDASNVLDDNLLARRLHESDATWVVIDLEQNLPLLTVELIRKLARHAFLNDGLKDRCLVLLVPPLYLGFYARSVNEAFNNLPVSHIETQRSGRTALLFVSSTLERLMLSMPLLTSPIRWCARFLWHIYRRLVRPA